MKKILILFFVAALHPALTANAINPRDWEEPSDQLITNIPNRQSYSLDGTWSSIVDPYLMGYERHGKARKAGERHSYFNDRSYYDNDGTILVERDYDHSAKLQVPGDWNTQNDRLYYYEGTLWYLRHFPFSPKEDKRYFLYFGAANYMTVAALNDEKLGYHEGGFTPFNFEVTGLLKEGDNVVSAMVDNRREPDRVPAMSTDWWNYGGLTRSVRIVEVPRTFIRDYGIQLKKDAPVGKRGERTISAWIQLDGPASAGAEVSLEIPELKVSVSATASEKGLAGFEFKARPELWCPESPKLYGIRLSSCSDTLPDEVGFRTIETKGSKVLLNGREIFCKGVCIHEERPFGNNGRAYSADHAKTLIGWAKEMGCNYVRLAHYPHNEHMVREAERQGLMVWSEVPTYWSIDWSNPTTYKVAEKQVEEMITRDRNRANIIIWSIANETPEGPERLNFLSRLADKVRSMDDTRLVTAAMLAKGTSGKAEVLDLNDALADKLDLISFNTYLGWYKGKPEIGDRIKFVFHQDKPVFISEFGGGALYGYHGRKDQMFTEEYIAEVYRCCIRAFERIDQLAGTTPWILMDFRSPRRILPTIQNDYNRKGLISENGERKTSFYVMQEWYRSSEGGQRPSLKR